MKIYMKRIIQSYVLWLVPIMAALERLKQEDHCECKASLGYNLRPYLKETKSISSLLLL